MKTSPTTYGIIAALLAGAAVCAYVAFAQPEGLSSDPNLDSREVISYEVIPEEEGATVSYTYLGEKLPERLVPDEVVELRTENSYTRKVGVEHQGTKEEKPILEAVVYLNPQYVESNGQWHYQEQATTTESAFQQAFPVRYALDHLIERAYAATLSPFSSSGDGQYQFEAFGEAGDEVTGIANCSSASHSLGSLLDSLAATTAQLRAKYSSVGSGNCDVHRLYLPFDTSSMGAGAVVSATTLHVWATSKTNSVNDGDDVVEVVNAGASFTSFGSLTGATGIDIGSITTGAYNTFTLDATGRSWISPTGTTGIGLVERHDRILSDIASNGTGNIVVFSMSENTGTTQDPYLTITYTPGSKFSFWMFQDF